MTLARIGSAAAWLLLCSGTLSSQEVIYAETTAESLKVRDNPGGEVIAQLPRGTRVAIIDARDSWAHIHFYSRGEATELRQGWVSEQYLRRTPGETPYRYGPWCESEDRSGAEVCLNVSDVSLDCDEGLSGDYYDSCNVAIAYGLETDHRGQSAIEVDVTCDVQIWYEGESSYTSSDFGSDWFSHDLGAHDSESGSMNVHFSFPSYDEVVSAEIESVDCYIEYLELE